MAVRQVYNNFFIGLSTEMSATTMNSGCVYLMEDTNDFYGVDENLETFYIGGKHTPYTNIVYTNIIGDVNEVKTIEELYNHTGSPGIMTGCEVTDNGNGTINISSGELLIKPDATSTSIIYNAEYLGQTNVPLSSNATNYVYFDYNLGSPTVLITLTPQIINMFDKVALAVITYELNDTCILEIGEDSLNPLSKLRKRFFYTEKYKRVDGGSVVGDGGGLTFSVTEGYFYFGLTLVNHPEKLAIDDFRYYYHIGGNWTFDNLNVINTTQYDNGTNLVPLSNNKFAVHWIYVTLGTNHNHINVVFSNNEYNRLADAQNAPMPSNLPETIVGLGQILGRVIVQEGTTEILQLDSSFNQIFSSAPVTLHNELAGLQGGTLNEYFHLSQAEIDRIDDWDTAYQFTLSGGTVDGSINLTAGSNFTIDGVIIESDKTYTHTQLTSSDTWSIAHNLNKHPSVTVIDNTSDAIEASIEYVDANNVIIRFNVALVGQVIFN